MDHTAKAKIFMGVILVASFLSASLTDPVQGADNNVERDAPQGKIGVGTWATQAEFSNIKVTGPNGETLCGQETTPNLETKEGTWTRQNGRYIQSGNLAPARAITGDANWKDYTLTLRARKIGGPEGFLILFYVRDENSYLWWNIGGWGNTFATIEQMQNGSKTKISDWRPVSIETGRWYDIKIELKGPGIRTYLDGTLINTATLVTRSGHAAPSVFGTTNAASSASPPTPERTIPTATLREDQARAVVLIKGDNAEGTGFLVKTPDGPAVVTNIHLIANNPNLKITTNTGAFVTMLSAKGASDRDLALLAVKAGNYSFLEMAPDTSQIVQPGDEVITPGNSQGGDVMLNTGGKVLGIGPERIEIDNPIYHGNSGGPVFHVKSGKVLGVVTEAIKALNSDELDKASFSSRNSATSGSTRYFALRLDTVSAWVPIDSQRIQNETVFLDQFDKRSRCLDCFLNAPDDDNPEDTLWRKDAKIVKANTNCFNQRSGADASQQMDANRILYADLNDIANIDMDDVRNSNNFYSFDRQRAKDEATYRKALKKELDEISDNVSRMGSLPRTNNN